MFVKRKYCNMQNVIEILERIAQIKNIKTDKKLSELFGVSPSTVATWKIRKNIPYDKIFALCKDEGLSLDYVINGKGSIYPSDMIAMPSDLCPCLDDFELFQEFEQGIAAGHGAYAISQEIERQFAFRKEWISRHGLNNKNCGLFKARGDSMLPLIGDGDIMLVDMSKKEMQDIIEGKIYCFSEGDLLKVKRLVRKGSGLLAISDNKSEIPNPMEVDMEQFRLIGKVVWIGHMVK